MHPDAGVAYTGIASSASRFLGQRAAATQAAVTEPTIRLAALIAPGSGVTLRRWNTYASIRAFAKNFVRTGLLPVIRILVGMLGLGFLSDTTITAPTCGS